MQLPRELDAGYDEHLLLDDLAGCTPVVTLGFLRRSPQAVKLVDRSGRLLYLNENALIFHGIDNVDDVVGQFWWDVAGPEMRHTLRNLVTRAGLGENIRTSLERQEPDGRTWQMEIAVTPVRSRDMRVEKLLVVTPTTRG